MDANISLSESEVNKTEAIIEAGATVATVIDNEAIVDDLIRALSDLKSGRIDRIIIRKVEYEDTD